MLVQDGVGRSHQVRFLANLPLASSGRWRQSQKVRRCLLKMVRQRSVQPLTVPFRTNDQDPFLLQYSTRAVSIGFHGAHDLIALGQQRPVSLSILAIHAMQFLLTVGNGRHPLRQLMGAVAGQCQGHRCRPKRSRCARMPKALSYLAVAHKQQANAIDDLEHLLYRRNVERIVCPMTGHDLRCHRQAQRVQRRYHHLDLTQARVILAVSKLKQAILTARMMTRNRRRVQPICLLQLVHPDKGLRPSSRSTADVAPLTAPTRVSNSLLLNQFAQLAQSRDVLNALTGLPRTQACTGSLR